MRILLALLLLASLLSVVFLMRSGAPDVVALGPVAPSLGAASREATPLELSGAASARVEVDESPALAPQAQGASGVGTLRGVVLGPDGQPVSALVRALPVAQLGRVAWLAAVQDKANARGEFELPIEGGGPYQLFAREWGVGTGTLGPLDTGALELLQDVELRLEGTGVLSGVLVDGAGQVIPNFALSLVPSEIEDSRSFFTSSGQGLDLEAEGRGLVDATERTDSEGRFEFHGLRPGPFEIWGERSSNFNWRRLLTAKPVATGSTTLRLQLRRRVLVVQVQDATGSILRPSLKFLASRPLQETVLFCLRSEASGRILEPVSFDGLRRSHEGDSVVFEVDPGTTYALGVVSPGAPLYEATVYIPDDRWSTHHLVQLSMAREPGRLKVTLDKPDGTRFSGTCEVVVRGAKSGMLVFETGRNNQQASIEVSLAPGVYRVAGRDRSRLGIHGERFDTELFAPDEVEVRVVSGSSTEVRLRVRVAGDLEMRFASGSALGAELLQAGYSRSLFGGTLILTRPQVGVLLKPVAGGADLRSELEAASRHEWLYLSGTEDPSVEVLTNAVPIPVGEYVLVARRLQGAPLEVPVSIVAGKTTTVEVEL